MKILHVASFCGNIGDNASHIGLYSLLRRLIGEFSVDRLEIRRFYKNRPAGERLAFDADFVRGANRYDLLIVGGGGFFDYWVEGSETGTTIDISPSNLEALTVPTLFASIGSHPHKEVPPGNVDKFRRFLMQVAGKPNMRILPRNDGSLPVIRTILGESGLGQIREILDNGFFYEDAGQPRYPVLRPGGYVAWNITTDQLAMNSALRAEPAIESYYRELADAIVSISATSDLDHVFVPHIGGDLAAISRLFAYLPDDLVRRRIVVAPYGQGDDAARFAFNVYRESRVVVGSRFHTNVCSIAQGAETVGLGILGRIKYLYDYFGIADRCVDVASAFGSTLAERVLTAVPRPSVPELLEEKRQDSLLAYSEALASIRRR